MHLRLLGIVERDDTQCGQGSAFYSCQNNHFRGCCSVDPCAIPWCPDASTPPPSSSVSSNGAPSSTSASNSADTTATATVTPPPSSVSSVTSTVVTPTSTQTTYIAGAFASTTSSPMPVGQSSSKSPVVPIIAGVVSGVVALSILSVLLWFCCKRRRQKKNVRESIIKYGMPTREYALNRAHSPEVNIPKEGDVFAEFGGRHKSSPPPSTRPATAPTPPPRAPTNAPMEINSPIDSPIPDMEKSGLTPPPVAEHPAFHVGGNSSQQPPAYHPGHPSAMHSPPMTSHPAYHVSQLSQHPAFSPPRTSPRSATFPRRTTEVKRQKSSPRTGGCSGPMDIAPIIPAPPSGRSELEAEVPASYVSPIAQSPPQNEIRVNTSTYNPADYAGYDARTRNNTLASTYSIPIGLGVVNSPLSPSQYQNSRKASLGVISPQSIISPQSPFHLETQYSHLSHLPKPAKQLEMTVTELREGKEKEAVVVSPLSPERWSGATVLNSLNGESESEDVEMRELNGGKDGKGKEMRFEQVNEGQTPVNETPTGLTPSDDFKTWETWAQR